MRLGKQLARFRMQSWVRARPVVSPADRVCPLSLRLCIYILLAPEVNNCISGLVAEYIVAIDVTRVGFPAAAIR